MLQIDGYDGFVNTAGGQSLHAVGENGRGVSCDPFTRPPSSLPMCFAKVFAHCRARIACHLQIRTNRRCPAEAHTPRATVLAYKTLR